MKVASILKKGFSNDQSHRELRQLHIGCCVKDLVDLFTVAAVNTPRGIDRHTEFAKHMMHVRAMERNHMPSEPVDMKALMIFASLGMFRQIEDSIGQSLNSVSIVEGDAEIYRSHVKNFILKDTSAAIALACSDVLSDPLSLKIIEKLSAYSEEKLSESIERFLEEKYDAPSSEDLGCAITERWVKFGMDPTQRNQRQADYATPGFA